MKNATAIWSDSALQDIETVFYFLKDKSLVSAKKIIKEIIGRVRQLESFPESGQKQITFQKTKTDYRYLVTRNYKIIYSISSTIIYIHAVFDCRQDPEMLQKKLL